MSSSEKHSGSSFTIRRRQFLKLLTLACTAAACQPFNGLSADNSEITPAGEITFPVDPGTRQPERSSSTPSYTMTSSSESTSAVTASSTRSFTPAFFPQFMIDGHEDIAWNAIEFDRDPLKSAYIIREQELGQPVEGLIGQRTTGFPEWIAGHVAVVFSTIFPMPAAYSYPGHQQAVYSTPQQAREVGWKQLVYYQDLVTRESSLTIIKNQSDLETVTASWVSPEPVHQPQIGLVLLMEGADPISDMEDVHKWHAQGLRIIGPAWKSTRYSAGTGSGGTLTLEGKRLLGEMAGLNMILDLSHLSSQAVLDALDIYTGPIIASHSNPAKFLPSDRGLTDEMIKQIKQHQGVIGILPYNSYLKPGWERGNSRSEVTIETVVNAIDYVVQLNGNAGHVALGSDFDGGFGLDSIPEGLDTAADLIKIATALGNRGYPENDISSVMSGNWLRILKEGLPPAEASGF